MNFDLHRSHKYTNNKKKSKINSQPEYSSDQGENNLPDQWYLHNNRIEFLEQSLVKMKRKIQKIQKSLTSVTEATSNINEDVKNQFRLKLKEIIQIVESKEQENKQKVNSKEIEKIYELKAQVSTLQSITISKIQKLQFQLDTMVRENQKNMQKNNAYFDDFETTFVNRIQLMEQENKHYIEQKTKQVSLLLRKEVITHVNQLQKVLNSSSHPNNNSKHDPSDQFKMQKSQTVGRKSNTPSNETRKKQTEPVYYQNSVENQPQSQQKTSPRPSPSSSLNSLHNITSNTSQTSQNNSRVVYLRQKLKQFEQINRKYDKKQSEYDRQKEKHNPNHNPYRYRQQEKSHECQEDHKNYFSKRKDGQSQIKKKIESSNKRLSSLGERALSGKKSLRQSISRESLTQQKNSLSRISSEKSVQKIDKLKSIKDYLQQSQSELDQSSLLEPNYEKQRRY